MKTRHAFSLLLATVSLSIAATVSAQEPEMMEAAPVQEEVPQEAVLKIDPPQMTQAPDTQFLFTVILTPGQYSVKALDLALTFDPQHLEILDAGNTEETAEFTQLTKTIDNEAGTVLFSLGVPPGAADTQLLTKEGAVATFSAMTRSSGSATIAFDREKTVVAVKEKELSAAGFAGDTVVTIQGEGEADATMDDTAGDPIASPIIPFLIPALIFIVGLGAFYFFFIRRK